MDDSTEFPPITGPKRRKARKYFLVATATLALTIALLYVEENWRGRRAWLEFKTQYEATGNSLDWSRFIPQPVRDEDNAFEAPHMHAFIKGDKGNEFFGRFEQVGTNIKTLDRVVLASVGIADGTRSNAVHLKSAAEARDFFQRLAARTAPAAQGFNFVLPPLTNRGPVELTLPPEILQNSEHSNLFSAFTVETNSHQQFTLTVGSAIAPADYLSQTDVLAPQFAALRSALARPAARLNGQYDLPHLIPIPNYVLVRTIAQTLGSRATCYLLLGKPEEALAELALIQDLRKLLEDVPSKKSLTLVSAMIDVAINGLSVAVVEKGFRLGAWREKDLKTLAEQLRRIDLLPAVKRSLRTELVAISHLCQKVPMGEVFNANDSKRKKHPLDYMPRGWVYQNMVVYARLMDRQCAVLDLHPSSLVPHKIDAEMEHLAHEIEFRSSPYIYLARLAIPNFSKAILTAARNQTSINEALIVCALERFRHARGEYPQTLNELVPSYLAEVPIDIIGGEPLKYRRAEDGGFLLYSVGWNQKDDGGQIASERKEGDWVWEPALYR